MKGHVYPQQVEDWEKVAIIEIGEDRYLVDLEDAEIILIAGMDIRIYSHELDGEPLVFTEDIVNKAEILGVPTQQKKLQNAVHNLQEKRPLYEYE